MNVHSYLKSAVQILDAYHGDQPFSTFIKKYFQQNKKYGSRDRKHVSHLCYCYFRLGKALRHISVEERILTGLFLCSRGPNQILEQLKPEWNKNAELPLDERLSIRDYWSDPGAGGLLPEEVFPWKEQLSEGMDHEKFSKSFFVQPDLFIRLRPGYENAVKRKLVVQGIQFYEISATCLSLPNASKIESILELDKEAVVQDYASQQTGAFFPSFKFAQGGTFDKKHQARVWDCCAGSGGKSLMVYDIDSDIDLTVSDLRESILVNLTKRFAKAGVKHYKSFVTDLTDANINTQVSNFDFIICDAPCTGSGTWSRTPEQLYYFDDKKIESYASLQKKILWNIMPRLKSGGYLLYITCSVFKRENEEVIGFIQDHFGDELVKIELLKGYEKKADTMFAALLKKKL